MEALRVGLVGYGGAGRGIHARLLRQAGQLVTCVVTRGRADQVEADWPGATVDNASFSDSKDISVRAMDEARPPTMRLHTASRT